MLKKYRLELMGISIGWIMLFHVKAALPAYLVIFSAFKSIGFLGVDIFFLLSGFGLSFSWWGSNGSRAFLKRRLFRILPGYWLSLLCVAIYYLVSVEPTWKQWFFSIFGMDFFILEVTDTWFVPSIVILYCLFPVVMWGKAMWGDLWICILCMLAWGIFYGFCFLWASWLLIFAARIPVFLLGIFLAFRYKEKGSEPEVSCWALVFLFALFVSVKAFSGQSFQWHTGILWLIGSLLAYPACYWLGRFLIFLPEFVCRVLRWMGQLSFELYLTHVFMFVLAERSLESIGYGVYALLAVFSFAGAWILNYLSSKVRSAFE